MEEERGRLRRARKGGREESEREQQKSTLWGRGTRQSKGKNPGERSESLASLDICLTA